jgi:hypothetical protein
VTGSRGMGRRVLFAAVTAALSLVFVLAVGEAMARLSGYRMPGVYDESGEIVAPDPVDAEGGPYRGVHGTLYHFDFEVPWINNRDGFRERERVPKAEGEWRIGILGDSFAAGYGVEVDERLSDRWFQAVRDRMPDAVSWNLGACNAGTQQLADVLGGVGRDYELDEIVLLLYSGNEGRDDIRWEKAQQKRERALAAGGSPPAKARSEGRRGRLRTWLRRSRLAMLVWTVAGSQMAQRVSRVDAPRIEDLSALDAPVERALDRFAREVGDRPLTIWYLPSRMEWDDEHWRFMKQEQGLEDDRGRSRPRQSVEAWAERNGIPFIDLTGSLLHRPAEEIRFEIDGHYTAEAHRRMAQLLVEHGGAAARLRDGAAGDPKRIEPTKPANP